MSTLYVDNIYSKTGTSQALTIDSSGRVTMPQNDSGWITPTLNSPFTNYGGVWGDLEYRKIGDTVNIQGLVNLNSAALGSTFFTFPSGYSPKKRLMVILPNGNSGYARVDIDASGNVSLDQAASVTTWVGFCITFMVA